MPTFELELRNYIQKSGKQPIVIRVTVNGVITRKSSGYSVLLNQWNAAKKCVKSNHPNYNEINDALDYKLKSLEREYALKEKDGISLSSSMVVDVTFNKLSFYEAADRRITEFTSEGKIGSAARYRAVFAKLKAFAPKLNYDTLTPLFLDKYKWYMQELKNKPNTILGNFNAIRAVVKYSISLGMMQAQDNPFNVYQTGSWKKVDKDNLTSEEILSYEKETLSGIAELARDMFLFSFYTAGMRFSDVLTLSLSSIQDGLITYSPGKTKDSTANILRIPVYSKAAAIIEKYKNNSPTLFGLITKTDPIGRHKEISQKQSLIRKFLQIGISKAGIGKQISFHAARHSFAKIANTKSGRDIYSIKSALGHSAIKTTEIYLGNDDSSIEGLLKKVYE